MQGMHHSARGVYAVPCIGMCFHLATSCCTFVQVCQSALRSGSLPFNVFIGCYYVSFCEHNIFHKNTMFFKLIPYQSVTCNSFPLQKWKKKYGKIEICAFYLFFFFILYFWSYNHRKNRILQAILCTYTQIRILRMAL